MIKREKYIKSIRPFYDSDLIKIITWIRRCSKSIILNQIKEEISKKTDNIIYLNFEDKMVSVNLNNSSKIIDYVMEHKKEGQCYVFFDEVQEIEDWNIACKTLRLHDCSLFITGSNSKLLSREFIKELSGRYVSFRIRPFVYKEIQEYCKQLNKECSVADYLVWGGFPKRFEFLDNDSQRQYLNDLDNTIVINDLIKRYRIRNEDLFKMLVNFILRSNSRIFSAKSIHNYIVNEKVSCSINTIMKYLCY